MNERVIYLRLVGGLGNQLYQFAFAYYLRERFDFDKIKIDTSGMSTYNEFWGVLLDIVISQKKISNFVEYGEFPILKYRIPKIAKKIKLDLSRFGFISDCIDESILSDRNLPKNLVLDGYFEKVAIRFDYKDILKPILRDDLFIDLPSNLVVINVRGGEFVRIGLSSGSDREYYKKSISEIKLVIPNPVFHLITDDVVYATKLLEGICIFDEIHTPDPVSNFKYLFSAKNKILSQSTFAKWAGFLGEQNNVFYYSEF